MAGAAALGCGSEGTRGADSEAAARRGAPASLEGEECVERDPDAADGAYLIRAASSAMASADAPTPHRARFTRDGRILVVDRTVPEVVETSPELLTFRPVGRHGPGPGEYGQPADAVGGPGGTTVILDRNPPSLVIYGADGSYRRELRLWSGAWALAADDSAVYVSSWLVPTRYADADAAPPVVARLRLHAGQSAVDTLLRFRPEWRGERPLWNLPGAVTVPRVGQDGEVYLAWPAANEIWRIEEDGYRVVVRGCVPDRLLEGYRKPGGERRAVGHFIADFAVRPDGGVVVRGGHAGEDRRLRRTTYSSDGELRRAWALGQDNSVFTRASLHPDSTGLELTWSPGSGTLRLLRFVSDGAESGRP